MFNVHFVTLFLMSFDSQKLLPDFPETRWDFNIYKLSFVQLYFKTVLFWLQEWKVGGDLNIQILKCSVVMHLSW